MLNLDETLRIVSSQVRQGRSAADACAARLTWMESTAQQGTHHGPWLMEMALKCSKFIPHALKIWSQRLDRAAGLSDIMQRHCAAHASAAPELVEREGALRVAQRVAVEQPAEASTIRHSEIVSVSEWKQTWCMQEPRTAACSFADDTISSSICNAKCVFSVDSPPPIPSDGRPRQIDATIVEHQHRHQHPARQE